MQSIFARESIGRNPTVKQAKAQGIPLPRIPLISRRYSCPGGGSLKNFAITAGAAAGSWAVICALATAFR
jgi:hypothetical protein